MLKQQTKLRVRLYVRLSKDDGDADKVSNSITNQLQMLRYHAEEKGFEVIASMFKLCYSCLRDLGCQIISVQVTRINYVNVRTA